MECIELFSIPLYKFKFEGHKDHKNSFMQYLGNDEIYRKNTTPGNSLNFTSPNLHQQDVFKPFVDFSMNSLKSVMDDLGFLPNIQMTGLWATRHINNGSHHRHTHGNSFLAGVYYLHGTPYNSGTIFYNTHKYHNYIIPAKNPEAHMKIQSIHTTKFEEGCLYIFPSWLEHSTGMNNLAMTNAVRHILSFNAMPLGKTNHDEFDRYDYQEASSENMITYREDRFK
jgi:uncharacterized protein (TIGR02466 family)